MRAIHSAAAMVLGLASVMALAADPDQTIRTTLKALQPEMEVLSIAPSPMPSIYQVELKGGRQLYASADGHYILQGYLYQYQNGQAVNLTEQAQETAVIREIRAIPEKDMVVFAPPEPKTEITIFTDTDCPYCQKLHAEVAELNRRGVTVRYLAFPRQGLSSHGARVLQSVWCARDRQAAMNLAKTQEEVPAARCDSPVARQYALGQQIGIQGTPAIILANGQIIPGYQPARILAAAALQASKALPAAD